MQQIQAVTHTYYKKGDGYLVVKTFINGGAVIHIEDSEYFGKTEKDWQKSFDKFAVVIIEEAKEQGESNMYREEN